MAYRSVFPCDSPAVRRTERQRSLHSLLRLRLRLETYPSELVSCGRSHATFAALTPTPAATLSSLPCESPAALRAGWRFSPASAGVENATAGSEASRSDGGALREPQDFSPWWLTVPFCRATHLRFFGRTGDFPTAVASCRLHRQHCASPEPDRSPYMASPAQDCISHTYRL